MKLKTVLLTTLFINVLILAISMESAIADTKQDIKNLIKSYEKVLNSSNVEGV